MQRVWISEPERVDSTLRLKVILRLARLLQPLNERSGTPGTSEPVGIEFI